jgi:hypothetical protein
VIDLGASVALPAGFAERIHQTFAPLMRIAETLNAAGTAFAVAVADAKRQRRAAWKAFTDALTEKRSARYRSEPAAPRNAADPAGLEAIEAFKVSERTRCRSQQTTFPDGLLVDLAMSPHGPPDETRLLTPRPPP